MVQADEILGIIPARMASTRFPGKPLVLINGIPMVIRVYREAAKVLKNLVIASGDEVIGSIARQYDANFTLTTGNHISGTSRCIEAMSNFSAERDRDFKCILNIQGDEPMLSSEAITQLAGDISFSDRAISTLVRCENDPSAFLNPNRVKVVLNRQGFALYFSRSPIPFHRTEGSSWYSHVGLYAFKKEILEAIGHLEPGRLEVTESLEQLRWLEYGYPIHCCETEYSGFGVDTPEDLELLLRSGIV